MSVCPPCQGQNTWYKIAVPTTKSTEWLDYQSFEE